MLREGTASRSVVISMDREDPSAEGAPAAEALREHLFLFTTLRPLIEDKPGGEANKESV